MATKKNTQVAKSEQYTVNDVPKLLAQAQAKLDSLNGNVKDEVKEITSSLPGFGKLSSITDPSLLVKAMGSVDGKEASYDNAFDNHFSGTTRPEFVIEGHSAQLWRDNILLAYTKLVNKEETAKVKQAIKLLKENLSKDEKFNNDMKSIVSLFAS